MLTEKEQKVLKETRIRNLKRRQAKLSQHAEFSNECLKIQKEIDALS